MSSFIFNCLYIFLITQLCCQNSILEPQTTEKSKSEEKDSLYSMSLCNIVRTEMGAQNYRGTTVCVRDKAINILAIYIMFSKGK